MLGQTIADPDGIEGPTGETPGLGLLPLSTVMGGHKTLTETHALDQLSGCPIEGYEMHMGQTQGPALDRPLLALDGRPEGAITADGQVMGCYLHGLFSSDAFRAHFLGRFGQRAQVAYEQQVDAALDALADHLEAHGVIDRLWPLAAPLQ
jgi:adenosylcobyric acid synthase